MTQKTKILIPRQEKLRKLIGQMKKAGPEKLHVLADFDRTLTQAYIDGEKIPSIISILRDGNYLTPDYAPKAHALYNKYHPIEIDSKITPGEKRKAMKKWWETHFKLLLKSGLHKKDIEKVVVSGKIKLRQGAKTFLETLHKQNIPLVIMSASGLGKDVIEMYLEKEHQLYDNIYIVSNAFMWDKKGSAIGFQKPIIHTLNKDETTVHGLPFFEKIKDRKHVILLGDSLGDLGMIQGFDYETLIKIGFLNEAVEENLPQYQENFDVIVLNDGNMNYLNDLLKQIII